MEIACDPGADSREAVAALAQRQGWPLRELRRVPLPLEDVFKALTAEPAEGAAS